MHAKMPSTSFFLLCTTLLCFVYIFTIWCIFSKQELDVLNMSADKLMTHLRCHNCCDKGTLSPEHKDPANNELTANVSFAYLESTRTMVTRTALSKLSWPPLYLTAAVCSCAADFLTSKSNINVHSLNYGTRNNIGLYLETWNSDCKQINNFEKHDIQLESHKISSSLLQRAKVILRFGVGWKSLVPLFISGIAELGNISCSRPPSEHCGVCPMACGITTHLEFLNVEGRTKKEPWPGLLWWATFLGLSAAMKTSAACHVQRHGPCFWQAAIDSVNAEAAYLISLLLKW